MSSKEFFFSSANAWFGLTVTPAIVGPCSTFALANAGSDRASALPAPSLRNSRRRTYSDLGVTSDQRMRDLRGDRTPPARAWLRFRRFRLAHDGRDCRRQRLRLLGRGRRRSAPLPRVPALPGRALFLRAQLRAVLIAHEPDPRAARAVQASFDAAAHVQRAPRPRRLRRKADDPLRRDRRGKLAFRREPAIALEDALLFRRGELARVVLAEPAVARACARLSAAGDRTQPPGAPAVEMDARTATHLDAGQGRGHLLFHLARDDGGQFAREPVDDRAKRRIPCLICHAIVPYSQISAAKSGASELLLISRRRAVRAKTATTCRTSPSAGSSPLLPASCVSPPLPPPRASARQPALALPSAPRSAAPSTSRRRRRARATPCPLLSRSDSRRASDRDPPPSGSKPARSA